MHCQSSGSLHHTLPRWSVRVGFNGWFSYHLQPMLAMFKILTPKILMGLGMVKLRSRDDCRSVVDHNSANYSRERV